MALSTTPDSSSGAASEHNSLPTSERRIVFVAGSGRSGTSTLSGILQQLGMHVPQPEVAADNTNPRGFGEPQWVVDHHIQLLRQANVHMSDARPQAWFDTGKLATREKNRQKLTSWLESQFGNGNELVVKDPRLIWFVGLWRAAAIRTQADACFATMLRPPTETVGSKYAYYRRNAHSNTNFADGIAAWVNLMLHTERATRGTSRVFIRYQDLLEDWTVPVFRAGDVLNLESIKTAKPDDIRAVHNFIDPTLRRVQLTWDDVPGSAQLRELASETWDHLNALSEPDADETKIHGELDRLLDEYVEFYGEAEAVARSSVIAAKKQAARPKAKGGKSRASASRSRRLANRVPHRVRALIPTRLRKIMWRAIAATRGSR